MTEVVPVKGDIGLKIDGVTIIGVYDAPITDKTTSVECTADADTAIRRNPVIDDADFSFSFFEHATGDAGQAAVKAAKAAHSLVTFIRYLKGSGAPYYTLSGYVTELAVVGSPTDDLKWNVKVDVSGGAVLTSS